MDFAIKHIVVICNETKDKELLITNKVLDYLKDKVEDIKLFHTCWSGDLHAWTPIEEIPEDTDIILVLGGDGTVMQVARSIYGRDIPLLGINLGELGFLAEINCDKLEPALDKLLSGDFMIEERIMLSGKIEAKDGDFNFIALNDIVLSRAGSLHIVNFDVKMNGQLLKSYKADGCIVSTPTGSTGYNLSAGGPIIDPTSENIVLTTVCAHDLFNKSVVLSADKIVSFEVHEEKRSVDVLIEVTFDGCLKKRVELGDIIHITKAPYTTKLVRLESISFIEILQKKMK